MLTGPQDCRKVDEQDTTQSRRAESTGSISSIQPRTEMVNENDVNEHVSPTAELGASPEQSTRRKSLSVTHRPGLLAQATLDWGAPTRTAEVYGRGPAIRPLNERPDDSTSLEGDS